MAAASWIAKISSQPTYNQHEASIQTLCREHAHMRTHTYTQPSHTQPRGRPIMPADDRPGWNKNVVVTSSISTGCRAQSSHVHEYKRKLCCGICNSTSIVSSSDTNYNLPPLFPLKYIGTSSYCRYSTADRTHVC